MADPTTGHRRRHLRAESRTPVPPGAIVSFELVLRYPPASRALIEEEGKKLLAGARPTAPRDAAQAMRAADPADVDQVRAFAARAGLTVTGVDPSARTVRLSGSAGSVNALFGITLMDCRAGATNWREFDGDPRIPPDLTPAVEAVLGLSTRPVA